MTHRRVWMLAALLALPAVDEVFDLNERARAALEQGRIAAAVRDLEKACRLAPDELVLRRNLAHAYFLRGGLQLTAMRLPDAAADYHRAIQGNPGEAGYRVHLAQLELRRYRLVEAERLLEQVVAQDAQHAQAWLLLGDARNLLDQLPEAAGAYERAAQFGDEAVAARARRSLERTRLQHEVERDYLTDVTSFFVIRYPHEGGGALFGTRLASVLDRARAEVGNALGTFPSERATVVLYPPEAFRRVTGTHDWVGGLFDRKIRLPIADPDRDRLAIEAAFRHEFTHLVVAGLSPACPTVLNEGLAQVMETGRGRGMHLLADYLDGRPGGREALPPLAMLPVTFVDLRDREEVTRAYLHSYAFVDHVVNLHGMGAVMRWVKYASSRPLAEAFRKAVGRSLADEEALFRDMLRTAR